MTLKICKTCAEEIPLHPTYKTQCLYCYQNNYKVCYNCNKSKPNSYVLCFDCYKLDKHKFDGILTKNAFKHLNYNQSNICKNCNYEKTYNSKKYCATCYICHFS